jgi:hypothetical protein
MDHMSNASTKQSAYYSLKEAALILGATPKALGRADKHWHCKLFPSLTRIQHVKPKAHHRGSPVLFVREQVDALAKLLQAPPIAPFTVARPLAVDDETINKLLAMGKGGERTLKQLGVTL